MNRRERRRLAKAGKIARKRLGEAKLLTDLGITADDEPGDRVRKALSAVERASSDGEAERLAVAVFGQRRGPAFARSVRSGQGLSALVDDANSAEGAIADAAKASLTDEERERIAEQHQADLDLEKSANREEKS